MGRRAGLRGRPALVFVAGFAVLLILFYLTWKSLMGYDIRPIQKDVFIEERQDGSYVENRPSLYEHKENIQGNEEGFDGEKRMRDPDYAMGDNEHLSQHPPPVITKTKVLVPAGQQPSSALPVEKEKLQTKSYYRKPDDEYSEAVKAMERFVHLDLKGAAPKMSYLKEIIPLLSKLGATGLLVEYEDMFPYTGILENVTATNHYSKDEILAFLSLAKANQLKVMPLVQTFGHMEFVLKLHDFRTLRESDFTPQVIGATRPGTYRIISEMINQIKLAHPESTHLHIGCDEVYELGQGASAETMQAKNLTKNQMFLEHVKNVVSIVKKAGFLPVMWDDHLRQTEPADISKFMAASEVEIMVWEYSTNVLERINSAVWDKYAKIFSSVWIASSFKGATGSRQFYTEPQYHVLNHFSWLDVITAYQGKLKFKGIALTGWQRYDHFATLCELLPVALPSLAACLTTMKHAGFTENLHYQASMMLNCSKPLEMTFPQINKKTKVAFITQDCRFPGHLVYYAMQEFYGYTQIDQKHRIDGWLSEYQVAHGFTSPGHLKVLVKSLTKQSEGYLKVSHTLDREMQAIYSKDTVEEWIYENIKERLMKIDEVMKVIQKLQQPKVWPRHPLPPLGMNAERATSQSLLSVGSNVDNPQKKAFIPNLQHDPNVQRERVTEDGSLLSRNQMRGQGYEANRDMRMKQRISQQMGDGSSTNVDISDSRNRNDGVYQPRTGVRNTYSKSGNVFRLKNDIISAFNRSASASQQRKNVLDRDKVIDLSYQRQGNMKPEDNLGSHAVDGERNKLPHEEAKQGMSDTAAKADEMDRLRRYKYVGDTPKNDKDVTHSEPGQVQDHNDLRTNRQHNPGTLRTEPEKKTEFPGVGLKDLILNKQNNMDVNQLEPRKRARMPVLDNPKFTPNRQSNSNLKQDDEEEDEEAAVDDQELRHDIQGNQSINRAKPFHDLRFKASEGLKESERQWPDKSDIEGREAPTY